MSNLIRFTGLAALLGGAVFISAVALTVALRADYFWLNVLGMPLIALGMLGIHAGQSGRLSTLAKNALLVGALGALLALACLVVLALGGNEVLWLLSMAGMFAWMLGSALFGLSIFRARSLPASWAGLLLCAGFVGLFVYNIQPEVGIVRQIIGGLLLGLFAFGWMALGNALWSDKTMKRSALAAL